MLKILTIVAVANLFKKQFKLYKTFVKALAWNMCNCVTNLYLLLCFLVNVSSTNTFHLRNKV